jgi:hypothetical protein
VILTWRRVNDRLFDVTVRDDGSITFAEVRDRRPTLSRGEVHATHCCVRHWCKYGDEDCPVMDGTVEGVSADACEWCENHRETAEGLPLDVLVVPS